MGIVLAVGTAALIALAAAVTVALGGDQGALRASHDTHKQGGQPSGHAAMSGEGVPAPGGPHDLDDLLFPPPRTPLDASGVREFRLTAREEQVEIADGVEFAAWTYNGTVPGPTMRVTEGDRVRIVFRNASTHPHTIHTHGIHPADQDGVFEVVDPGDTFTYEFVAGPAGLQVFHCHAMPLKKHIHRGLYGTFIVDPKTPRPPAKELVMLMNGFDTDGDGENNFYTVNGKAFYYAKYPIKVRQGEPVRIYLSNMTEFDAVNSLHLHGNFYRYYPTGTGEQFHYTDMVTLAQGERGVVETTFPHPGRYMFHAHQSEFADLGWMGFFDVEKDPSLTAQDIARIIAQQRTGGAS